MIKKNKKIIILISIFLILIISWFFSSNLKSSNNNQNKSLAKIAVQNDFANLGEMKVNEEKSYDFKIKNIGQEPLKIFKVGTSCDCTFAKIIINNQESPEFNMPMHNNALAWRWIGEILPNEEAIVKVIYRPYIMPVFGPIEREVFFSTNDASNPKVKLTIKAFVTK